MAIRTLRRALRLSLTLGLVAVATIATRPTVARAQTLDVKDKKTNPVDRFAHKISLAIATATEITTQAIRMTQTVLQTFQSFRTTRDGFYNFLHNKVGQGLAVKPASSMIAASDNDVVRDAAIVEKLRVDYYDLMFPAERQMALMAADALDVAVEAQREAQETGSRADAFAKHLNDDGADATPVFSADSVAGLLSDGSNRAPPAGTAYAAVRGRLAFLRRAAWNSATQGMPVQPTYAIFAAAPTEFVDSDSLTSGKKFGLGIGRRVVGSMATCVVPAAMSQAPATVVERVAVAATAATTARKATEAKLDAASARMETVQVARAAHVDWTTRFTGFMLDLLNFRTKKSGT